MKIKIELDDGYEEVFEVDEENDEIKDLGTTKEMMQARIEELEELNRDQSGDIVFYHEANMACQKEINALRDKAKGWEKRCGELEQELRDAQGQLDESVRKEAQLGLEYNKLRDRIWEQNWTIAQYDDENRELKERLCKCGDTPFRDSLSDLAKRIHRIAVDHGWWETEDGKCDDGDRPYPEILALCHSELSEALEEYRNGKPMAYQVDGNILNPLTFETKINTVEDVSKWRDDKKPEGIAIEMLDCIIRILDWMGHEGIDVDTLMEKKVKYNESREHRHGGKKA